MNFKTIYYTMQCCCIEKGILITKDEFTWISKLRRLEKSEQKVVVKVINNFFDLMVNQMVLQEITETDKIEINMDAIYDDLFQCNQE